MRTLSLILTVIIAMSGFANANAQIKSLYTSTGNKACRELDSNEEGVEYTGRCRGVGGYALDLYEGDLRQSLIVITPAKKEFDLGFTNFFANYSVIGDKVEWRTKAGVPFALIARYTLADPVDGKKSTSYLMVAKIGTKGACVVDVIDPGPKQNKKARISADSAAAKPCKVLE